MTPPIPTHFLVEKDWNVLTGSESDAIITAVTAFQRTKGSPMRNWEPVPQADNYSGGSISGNDLYGLTAKE